MTEVYKVGVAVGLGGTVTADIAKMILGFGEADKSAKALHGTLGKIGALAAGGALAAMFVKGTEEARNFDRELTKLSIFGMGDKMNMQAAQFAKGMNIVGTSATDAMRLMREAQGTFRESGMDDGHALSGAMLAAPMLAKIEFIAKALGGESGTSMNASALSMLRFIDMKGGMNSAEDFNRIANAGFKAIQSSGGSVNWEQYRQFAARAGVAGQSLTDAALYGELEPVITELKGSTAGFAARTAYNRLNGIIKVPNQVVGELLSMGVWDKSKVQLNDQGGIKKFLGNPLMASDEYAQDFVQYYLKRIKPLYEKKGITSPEAIGRENALLFGSTGGAMFSLIDRQSAVIERSLASWRKAHGIDEAVKDVKSNDPIDAATLQVTADFHDILNRLGHITMPFIVGELQAFDGVLKDIIAFLDGKMGSTATAIWNGIGKTVGNMTGYNAAKYLWNADWSMPSAATITGYGLGNYGGAPPSKQQQQTHVGDMYVDGNRLAQIVLKPISEMGSRPNAGYGGVDGHQTFTPVGAH